MKRNLYMNINKFPKSKVSYFIVILFFAIFARVFLINLPLYDDEQTSFLWYTLIPLKDLIFGYSDPNQHTLFILLSKLSMKVFGEIEWAFRLPVIIAGILSIPMAFLVSYSIFKSNQVSILTSFVI